MTQPHKHADILRAIADGLEVEYRSAGSGRWFTGTLETLSYNQELKWRIKPATIIVNNCEVPAENPGFNRSLIRISCDFRNGHSRALQFANDDDARLVYAAIIKPFDLNS